MVTPRWRIPRPARLPLRMKVIVGLGNPGLEYHDTRHNIGFMVVDELARRLKISFNEEKRWHGLVAKFAGGWLLKPQTFMNDSGRSVRALSQFYKITPAETLVVYDDVDLALGRLRFRSNGSAAGHNGLKDIHGLLGTQDFWRLRLGIGHPGVKSEVVHWVLKKPSLDHRIAIDQCIDRTLKALPALLEGDMEKATMLVHTSKPPRPKPPRPDSAQAPPAPGNGGNGSKTPDSQE